MKKIVILDGKTLGNIDLEKLNEIGEVDYYEFTSEDEVSNRIKDANIILTNKVILNEDNMKNANKLEFIAETATGFNNIDVDYARKRGIGVSNVAGYSTSAVVQHTFAMALGLLNEVIYHDNYVKSGEYSKSGLFTCLNRPYYEIQNKVWGIIGLGVIGRRVARIAEAFGAKVIYYSTSGRNNSSEFERVEFEELLNKSDIISIHVILTPETTHVFNREVFKRMKNTAMIINTSRGPVIDNDDLAWALETGEIRYAGLDTVEHEPLPKNDPFKELDNIIVNPHCGSYGVGSKKTQISMVCELIPQAVTTKKLPGRCVADRAVLQQAIPYTII